MEDTYDGIFLKLTSLDGEPVYIDPEGVEAILQFAPTEPSAFGRESGQTPLPRRTTVVWNGMTLVVAEDADEVVRMIHDAIG